MIAPEGRAGGHGRSRWQVRKDKAGGGRHPSCLSLSYNLHPKEKHRQILQAVASQHSQSVTASPTASDAFFLLELPLVLLGLSYLPSDGSAVSALVSLQKEPFHM